MAEMPKNAPMIRASACPLSIGSCTARQVLTTEWIDGTSLADLDASGRAISICRRSAISSSRASCAMPSATVSFMPTCTRAISSWSATAISWRSISASWEGLRRRIACSLPKFSMASSARLSARRASAFRCGLCAAHQDVAEFRAGAARHRRADHGPAGRRNLHGAAS